MDLRMLGPFEVWDGSHQLRLDSGTQRTLLAVLAIQRNVVVSTDRIIDALWGDDPPSSPLRTLRYHVSKLRSTLGDVAVHVVTRSPGYLLEVDPGGIDVHRFEAMAAEGRDLITEEPERAARMLVEALGMWRGSALVDFEYESLARGEITRLEELRLSVMEDRIAADLAAGRHNDLVGELQVLVAEHPLRERLWGQLMTALDALGTFAGWNDPDAFLALIALAGVCTETDAVTAVRRYGAAQAIRARKKLALAAHEAQAMDENCARLRAALGEASFERERATGEEMTTEEVVAFARDALQPGPTK